MEENCLLFEGQNEMAPEVMAKCIKSWDCVVWFSYLMLDNEQKKCKQREKWEKANYTLGCIKSSVTSKSREGILPLHSSLMMPHLDYSIQLWGPHHRKDMDLLGLGPEEAMKMERGVEYSSYEDMLRELGLFCWEEKAQVRIYCGILILKGGLEGRWGQTVLQEDKR